MDSEPQEQVKQPKKKAKRPRPIESDSSADEAIAQVCLFADSSRVIPAVLTAQQPLSLDELQDLQREIFGDGSSESEEESEQPVAPPREQSTSRTQTAIASPEDDSDPAPRRQKSVASVSSVERSVGPSTSRRQSYQRPPRQDPKKQLKNIGHLLKGWRDRIKYLHEKRGRIPSEVSYDVTPTPMLC